MGRGRNTAHDSAAAGITAASVLTGALSGINRGPDRVTNITNEFVGQSGFDRVKKFHSLLFAGLVVFVGLPLLMYAFRDTGLVRGGLIMFVIAGTFTGLSYLIVVTFNALAYTAIRLRCRLWRIDNPQPSYGLLVLGNPLFDIVFILPFRLTCLLVSLPFYAVASVYEILRVLVGYLAGKPDVSYRGDAGKLYDRARKYYAELWEKEGAEAANEFFRLAFSGLITPLGTEIPKNKWLSATQRDAWMAPLIRRHGPIEKYVKGPAGSSRASYAEKHGGIPNSTGGYTYDYTAEGRARRPANPVPKKYDAL